MSRPEWADAPLFSTPSGDSLDEPLSELLISAGNLIDRKNVISAVMILMDANGQCARSAIVLHPLAAQHMAMRLRAAADDMEARQKSLMAPETNTSKRVN